MLQIVGFVLVIAAMYAIKAVVISRAHDQLAGQSSSFSWMSARPEDEALAAAWSVAEEPQRAETHVATGALRPIGGASA